MEECGISFDRMKSRSIHRDVTNASQTDSVTTMALCTKGNLKRVTTMAAVSADGRPYKPVVVFKGKQQHFRRVSNFVAQNVHDALPPSYVIKRHPAGMDSVILLSWTRNFLEETSKLRADGKYIAIILDGISGQIQFEAISLFRENRVVVSALPSHYSHR